MKQISDWNNLGFEVRNTNAVIISRFKDGEWSEPEVVKDFQLTLNVYSGVLHYANSCFEGLKAFRGVDGKVRLFRPDENARRMQRAGVFLDMAYPSEEMFVKMCLMCVKENLDFLPPYGYNASMYLRPLLIGSNPQLNLLTSTEVTFIVMGNPVGSYSGTASLTPVNAVICRDFDRAAPNGTGSYKLSANYAPSFRAYNRAHAAGYKEILFTDSLTHTKIDEFGSSNFFAIKGNSYVTPLSDSVLPSITNKSLQQLAADFGMRVEKRVVPVSELDEFSEDNACGTAVVITPIWNIVDKATIEDSAIIGNHVFGSKEVCGKTSAMLYNTIRGIQDGAVEDTHSWCVML